MKLIDITGQKFGMLTVQHRENGKWLCLCDCGNIKYCNGSDLRKGRIMSCGCKKTIKYIDLTGQKFGRLTVLEIIPERRNKRIYWKCQCDCGAIVEVDGNRLRSGNTQSCGCLHKELLAKRNMENSTIAIGQIYGKLTVIEYLGLRKQKSRDKKEAYYLCKCECGNFCEVSGNQLQSKYKKSCGCLHSSGEFLIEKILQENNIQYKKEYSFSNLRNIRPLRFDFAVFDDEGKLSFLIEVDGRQHYLGPEAKWSSSSTLEEIQFRDNKKNEYCAKNNIILKRIPYYRLSEITIDNLIDDTFDYKENSAYEL